HGLSDGAIIEPHLACFGLFIFFANAPEAQRAERSVGAGLFAVPENALVNQDVQVARSEPNGEAMPAALPWQIRFRRVAVVNANTIPFPRTNDRNLDALRTFGCREFGLYEPARRRARSRVEVIDGQAAGTGERGTCPG